MRLTGGSVHGRADRTLVCGAAVGRSVELAVELARAGARFLGVGGVARALAGSPGHPTDLDVLVLDADVEAMVAALAGLGVPTTTGRLRRGRDNALVTAWGPLDVFVRPALPPSVRVDVAGCALFLADE